MPDREIREPDNSTVDDWFGQKVDEDAEVADRAVAEAGGDEGEAQRLFDEHADGKKEYQEAHRRPR
jgi:hypothetical protein